MSLLFVIIGYVAYENCDMLFLGEDVTTLGASAILMIFVNATAWPTLLEKLQGDPRLDKYTHEMERAEHFVKQLDVIVGFVSSVINNIKSLHKKADDHDGKPIPDDDWEMDSLFDSESEDEKKKKFKVFKYINPLQLYNSNGKQEEYHLSLDLENKIGYLFESILQVDVVHGFTFSKGSENAPDVA